MQFIPLLILLLVGFFIYRLLNPSFLSNIEGRKHYYFDFEKFSSQEFYELVKKAVEKREIGASISKVVLSQAGWLEGKREYLRVSRDRQTFDICAAPFGTGFFVSYWLGEKNAYLRKIPIVNWFLEKKTYYEYDTEDMYKDSVKTCINEAIDAIGPSVKGARALSDIQIGAEGLLKK